MAIRRILTVDNAADLAILKQVSSDVPAVTDELRALMDDMLETMYDAPGIGLAAVQVGELVNVIVMDLAREGEEPAPATSSIRRSPGSPRSCSRTRKAACRCPRSTTPSSARPG